jgi:hypothetical protein
MTDMAAMRKRWSDFDPAIRSLLEETSSVTRWKIAELPELESWSSESGRVILMGDGESSSGISKLPKLITFGVKRPTLSLPTPAKEPRPPSKMLLS